MFDRYNIVNEDDLKKASQQVIDYHNNHVSDESGHNLGTVEAKRVKAEESLQEARPILH